MSRKHRRRGGFLGGKSRDTREYKESESGVWTLGDAAIANSEHPVGGRLFSGVGTSTFVIPDGVEYISIVCIGGGGGGMYWNSSSSTATYAMQGGGGGGLAWANNIEVAKIVENNTDPNPRKISIDVGAGGGRGMYSGSSTAGGRSRAYFNGGWATLLYANGGDAGRYNTQVQGGYGLVGTYYLLNHPNAVDGVDYKVNTGGGSHRFSSSGYGPGGGGGAAGYTANGGLGRSDAYNLGDNGAGGGGAGGGASDVPDMVDHISGSGGGVFPYGQGESGLADLNGMGGGGSGGHNGKAPTILNINTAGGKYGGGGGGSSSVYFGQGGNGAQGCVRIIWGDGREFPNKKVDAYHSFGGEVTYSVAGNY